VWRKRGWLLPGHAAVQRSHRAATRSSTGRSAMPLLPFRSRRVATLLIRLINAEQNCWPCEIRGRQASSC